jgi:hypothetical protein
LIQENETKMDAIVLTGADTRLESEIETGRDKELHFKSASDVDQYAVYGPYITLPTGRYRIELELAVAGRATGRVGIELCHSGARIRLYDRPCFEWELARGVIRVSYPFEQPVENLEVRLRVPGGFAGSIRQLSFQRLADEPS